MTRVSNLFRLQAVDSQIDALRARMGAIDSILNDHSALEQAALVEGQAVSAAEAANEDLRKAEEAAQTQQRKILDTDKALYGGSVRNPKELQDLTQEAGSLRRHLATLEDRQIQAMVRCEETSAAAESAAAARKSKESERAAQAETLLAERSALETELEKSLLKREAALAAIAEEDQAQYESLRRTKRGVAVARIEGGSCTGCGVAPSAARIDSARSGQEIIPCGNCGRILYVG